METNEIKEAMAFFAIIFNRGDGFWARRWKFFELINNRGDTIIRSHRVIREGQKSKCHSVLTSGWKKPFAFVMLNFLQKY